MAPATQPAPQPLLMKTPGETPGTPPRPSVVKPPAATSASDDGTAQLLKWGGWTLATGLLCALLTKTLFGGITPQGPHTNSGWMALIVALMCLPFGFLLFLLGALKWLRNRRGAGR